MIAGQRKKTVTDRTVWERGRPDVDGSCPACYNCLTDHRGAVRTDRAVQQFRATGAWSMNTALWILGVTAFAAAFRVTGGKNKVDKQTRAIQLILFALGAGLVILAYR